jgi:hypothetical protein
MNHNHFSQSKTPILLERNIRQQILLASHTFEPQIKTILQKLESISSINLKISTDFNRDFQALFRCPICKKNYLKASFAVFHLVFIHRNFSFEFKLEQSHGNQYVLFIKGKTKEKRALNNLAFVYRCKSKKLIKGMRYEVKLSVQNTLKKGFSEEIDWRKKPKTNTSMMFMSDSDEEKEKKASKSLSREEIKRKLEGKMFYHSNNIMEPIKDDSLFEESELEIDDKPIRESEEKAINDFEDIDETDKEFFKLWNNFVRDFNKPKKRTEDIKNLRLVAFCKRDYKLLLSDFVTTNKAILGKLRYNFVMHLVTFQIYGLINGNDILQLLLELDEKQNNLNNPINVN